MPARAITDTASQVARALPEHSSRTSGSTPASARDVPATSIAFRPSVAASRSRCGLTSVTVTESAPYARAVCAAMRPIGPAPVTSTMRPGETWARRQAQTPTDSGSSRPAASSLMLSGTGKTNCAGITTYWLKAPSFGGVAKNFTSGHRL